LLATEVIGTSSLNEALSAGLDIAVVADNDFYSQSQKVNYVASNIVGPVIDTIQLAELNLPKTTASLARLPHFMPTGTTLTDVNKTGLGSSAALITSLVSALLLHLHVISQTSFGGSQPQSANEEPYNGNEGKKLAHNLAQFIHCLAQGKIGSGFDIAAAVFGSQIYTRFNPAAIKSFMEGDVVSIHFYHQIFLVIVS
jgi:phosphomevalonate kinase